MKKILLQTSSLVNDNNNIFKSNDINNASIRWHMLKERLSSMGHELMTADDNDLKDCEGVIFSDAFSLGDPPSLGAKLKIALKKLLGMKIYPRYPARQLYKEAIAAGLKDKIILLIWEANAVCSLNFSTSIWKKFDRILTWDDNLIKNPKFIKYNIPMEPSKVVKEIISFSQKKLLVNISFNKYSKYKNELYSERRKLISYFESNFPNDFDLYGLRWNRPITRWQMTFPFLVKKYSTFRGHSKDKIDTLSHYKFNIAYENISDAKGYIADRIFSAFQAKSVPIYWGAPNIEEYIDADAFIDRRQFKNNAELAQFLKQMTEQEYNKYIDAANRFMQSEKYAKFLPENFCNQVIKALNIKT